ncbi:DEAD/DEAH box helicase [Paenibacillus validus]|uniref:DEAD/DEAH box helicase n=1 Tax=Paenibacillus validus TaxID=44253 RepID=UPI003D29AD6D
MKAFVYLLDSAKEKSWHVSLELRADRDHSVRVHGRDFRLRVLEPSLSFGQAYALVKSLNGRRGDDLAALRRAAAGLGWKASATDHWRLWSWRPQASDEVTKTAWIETDRLVSALAQGVEGRSLLLEELEALLKEKSWGQAESHAGLPYLLQLAWLQKRLALHPGIQAGNVRHALGLAGWRRAQARCLRCGSTGIQGKPEEAGLVVWSGCPSCGTDCPYCEGCLTMGRVRSCSPLVQGIRATGMKREVSKGPLQLKSNTAYLESWGLSPIQAAASEEALSFLKANKSLTSEKTGMGRFLIWAVTGAGKTEMIFPMIQYTVESHGKVAVVTPRRDVVLELKPRLEKAFPHIRVVTLYGGSEQRWERGELTLATTHQMMRFKEAFDLVIVDEIDAFPYHNNPMLLYAVEQVCSPGGSFILLSATPPEGLQQQVRAGLLPHARVPARYHRRPLPEPVLLRCSPIKRLLQEQRLPARLQSAIQRSLTRGAQVFVFVPNIKTVDSFVTLLRSAFPGYGIEGTSSRDAERAEKVVSFRSGATRLLVTTTILERGVTIPKSDVFILEAGSSMFDAASLVQMAGRAGRSAQDPNGFVYFAAEEKTRSQVQAVKQIKEMNALARKRGYID